MSKTAWPSLDHHIRQCEGVNDPARYSGVDTLCVRVGGRVEALPTRIDGFEDGPFLAEAIGPVPLSIDGTGFGDCRHGGNITRRVDGRCLGHSVFGREIWRRLPSASQVPGLIRVRDEKSRLSFYFPPHPSPDHPLDEHKALYAPS